VKPDSPTNPDLRIRRIQRFNDRVWDLTIHLVHPTLFYVLFQLLIRDHASSHSTLRSISHFHPIALGLDLGLFLGAWAVFYTTLLRDMGFFAPSGTVLLWTSFLSCVIQYVALSPMESESSTTLMIFLGVQFLIAGIGWTETMLRWAREKRLHALSLAGDDQS
jgi:uncharacterized membrane protein HdeD (DUF308 family)